MNNKRNNISSIDIIEDLKNSTLPKTPIEAFHKKFQNQLMYIPISKKVFERLSYALDNKKISNFLFDNYKGKRFWIKSFNSEKKLRRPKGVPKFNFKKETKKRPPKNNDLGIPLVYEHKFKTFDQYQQFIYEQIRMGKLR